MNRTKGSWLVAEYDNWEVKLKVELGSVVADTTVKFLGTRAEVERIYRSLSTDFGKAKLLKDRDIPGVIVEVGDLFRNRGMTEKILVREPKTKV